jgi:hypothetical protein
MARISSALLCCVAILVLRANGGESTLDTAKIDEITGLKGAFNQQEGVFKVSAPRTDVKVSIDQATMPPFMGLTSWAAFMADQKSGAMVMGDLVLFQDEVNPVLSTLLENGVEVTALHNHFFFDEPKVYFMHIGGSGKVEALAGGVRKALDKVKEIRAAKPVPSADFGSKALPAQSSVTATKIEEALGTKGMAKDGMFKAVIGRTVKMDCGCEPGKEMGVNTWAAFMGADDNALVDGDFVVTAGGLQAVLGALRKGGINIVAIHHHMVEETPRMIFLHYWGRGDAAELAKTVKSALDVAK